VPGSNLAHATSYPGWRASRFSSVPPRKLRNSTSITQWPVASILPQSSYGLYYGHDKGRRGRERRVAMNMHSRL